MGEIDEDGVFKGITDIILFIRQLKTVLKGETVSFCNEKAMRFKFLWYLIIGFVYAKEMCSKVYVIINKQNKKCKFL